ncbi:MAG: glycoside hydrolase family 99-like domain-containing protein [Gemmatimonadaceae bacterium]|nr:glycoside hydrolase family 99-like domain-containing protein [Gemmatimonadaceae bacterium]
MRALAIYLPQFHPIPENDRWWGRGFTEWTNVARARPLFRGHYQPHLPADLGFCDLRVPEVRDAQASLAREAGIHGFCYYHYWFTGRRVLERPFREVLERGTPDFPFCLCWANENWTRRWDGMEQDVLLQQHYSAADDVAHMESLLPAFADPRYIRVGGRPVFLVYRTGLLPEPARTADRWRDVVRRAGLGDLYLIRVENFTADPIPADIGFDAAMPFVPDWRESYEVRRPSFAARALRRLGLHTPMLERQRVMSYTDLARRSVARKAADYVRFPCVTPMWDNTARRQNSGAAIFHDSTPALYQQWLHDEIARFTPPSPDENFIFINAWNEWAEGNHLEPCQRWGSAYLDATRAVMARTTVRA